MTQMCLLKLGKDKNTEILRSVVFNLETKTHQLVMTWHHDLLPRFGMELGFRAVGGKWHLEQTKRGCRLAGSGILVKVIGLSLLVISHW